jgi:hypothetical protein
MKNNLNATLFILLHLKRISRKNIAAVVYDKLETESGETRVKPFLSARPKN